MAATNYTPIQLYFSTTASAVPLAANLAQGELAINITDGKLYYEDNAGVVQVIATKGAGTVGGSTTQIQYNNAGVLAGNAAMTFNSGTSTTTLTTLNLTNALGATHGGTAQSAYTQGDFLYASATNTLSKLGIGTVNYILTSTGTVPQWSAPSTIVVQTATNLAGGLGGSVPYQSAVDTTTFLAIGAANRVMTSTGSAPQWVTSLTGLTGVSSSSITNTSLTSGRVVVSTTAGLQADDADLTFDGTTLSAGGLSTVGLSTLVKTVTIGNSSFNGAAVFAAATPAKLYIGTGTVTDVTSAIGATNAVGAVSSLAITPIAATNTSVTYTNAATLYIAGAPSAGTNVTLTNPYALYVAAGDAYFGGTVTAGTVNLTTLDLTNLEVTNIKAKDGTAAMTIADSTGVVSFTANPILSGGTANGVLYLNGSKSATSGTALVFDGTNLGLGVTPSAWRSTNPAFQIAQAGCLFGYSSSVITGLGSNTFINSGGDEKYIVNGTATLYQQNNSGKHIWYNAPSGTAGDTISFTQAMTLDASGNLMVGSTSSSAIANKNIDVNGTGDAAFVVRVGGTTTSYLYSTAGQTILGTVGALPITFNPNGTERVRIDSSGNLLVGTTSTIYLSRFSVAYDGNAQNGPTFADNRTFAINRGGSVYLAGQYDTAGNYRPFGGVAAAKENATDGNSAGYLTFRTNNNGADTTERARIDSSGNLLVGTTSANGKLTVASGATTFVAGLTSTGTNTYTPTASTSLVNSTLQLSGGNASGATTGIRMSQSSSFELFFGGVQESGGAGAFVFQGYSGSAYAERARIDSSGNLGLGTTSPAQRLDVAGTIRLTPNTADLNYSADIFASYDSAHPFQINVKNNATTAEYMGVYADGGGANNRVVFPTGNVGIGTTSPAAKLHIAVPDASVDGTKGVKITNAAGTTVVLECGVSSDSFVGTTSGSLFNIRTQNVVRATFDTSGNFLVGTTSGSSAAGPRIYVDNTNNVSGDSGIFALLGSNCSNTSSAAFSALITGVGNKFYVYGNGNVVNTNNSYGAISDVKFKENIVDATPKLNDVLNLKVRNFNLKTEPNNKQIGFIAQEFEEVFPSMIDVSPDTDATGKALETTHKSIKLSVLVPILVKAIQEQQTIIESLKARLDAANL